MAETSDLDVNLKLGTGGKKDIQVLCERSRIAINQERGLRPSSVLDQTELDDAQDSVRPRLSFLFPDEIPTTVPEVLQGYDDEEDDGRRWE